MPKDEYESNVKFQDSVRDEYHRFCKENGWARVNCVSNDQELLDIATINNRICLQIEKLSKINVKSTAKPLKEIITDVTIKKRGGVSLNPSSGSDKTNPMPDSSVSSSTMSATSDEASDNAKYAEDLNTEPVISRHTQMVLKRRHEQQQKINASKGVGNRAAVVNTKGQKDKHARQQELLRLIKSNKMASGVTRAEHVKAIQSKQNPGLVKEPEQPSKDRHVSDIPPQARSPKSLLLPLEVIERTRKTVNICKTIFGNEKHAKDMYYYFLQKGYNELPEKIKKYFKSLMQHYFSGDLTVYPEDVTFKKNLTRGLLFDEKWSDNMNYLYREYKIAINKDDYNRRWFPEELIIMASICKQRIQFGDVLFEPVSLDKLPSLYVNDGPLKKKYLEVSKYLHKHTPTVGVIQINI
jgi:hypothetical protein